MAAMAHAHYLHGSSSQANLTPKPIDLKDWPVDLGTLDDLRTHGASGPVYIEFDTSAGSVKWGFGFDSDKSETRDLLVSNIEWPRGKTEGSSGQVPPTPEPSFLQPVAASGTIFGGLVERPRSDTHRIFSRLNSQQWHELPGRMETRVELLGLAVNSATHTGGTSVELNVPVLNEIRQILQHLTYLRATRIRPNRAYDKARISAPQVIGYDGQGTARLLNERGGEDLIVKLPPVIPKSLVEMASLVNKKWEDNPYKLLEAVSFWLHHLDLADLIEAVQSEDDRSLLQIHLTLSGQKMHDVTEVGFGVSQVLPVLVAGLLQPKDSLFIVDLPEAHLHPRPQAELADFFCSLALSDRSVLVETHSEMFINQLRLRAEMTPGLMDKIAVYFIDPPKNGHCAQPRPIDLSSEGELRWPAGFLQESWEIETRISAVREARRKAAK
jgi:predicted ATPase